MRAGVSAGVRAAGCWGAGRVLTVTSCGLVKKTPRAMKTEPMIARFCGVPFALMNENTPPPCRSEPVATYEATERERWVAGWDHSD